jgi:hypothetical protein
MLAEESIIDKAIVGNPFFGQMATLFVSSWNLTKTTLALNVSVEGR